jgi:hypothetical protein
MNNRTIQDAGHPKKFEPLDRLSPDFEKFMEENKQGRKYILALLNEVIFYQERCIQLQNKFLEKYGYDPLAPMIVQKGGKHE